ncbi:MAG: protease complex subunit PrcB family protein [Lachnospiraceae bacterium]
MEKCFWKRSLLCLIVITAFSMLMGCTVREGSRNKVRDLDYTVLPEAEIPQEFYDFINENKETPMKLTYITEDALYVCVGYGKQETGGYSISVEEFYETTDGIVIDTTLIGPTVSETQVASGSFPFLVIKTEKMDVPVIFE